MTCELPRLKKATDINDTESTKCVNLLGITVNGRLRIH